MSEVTKDKVYRKAEEHHWATVNYLEELKDEYAPEEAYRLAQKYFAKYMIDHFTEVLAGTDPGSQERFDVFRCNYEKSAESRGYLKIVESTPTTLKVRFDRCPFVEVMREKKLSEFSSAFCVSDYAFTKECLPGVAIFRSHEIAKGDGYCDHMWHFDPLLLSNSR